MKTFKVEDMHCGKCAERIKKAFSSQGYQIEVNLEEKTVLVPEGKAAAAAKLLEEIGYGAVLTD